MKQEYETTVPADDASVSELALPTSHLPGGNATIQRIVAEQETNADCEYNVLNGGSYVLSANQAISSSDTLEEATPDQNKHYSGLTKLEVEVTSAGSADNLHVSVEVDVTPNS